jgi:hypothetical protein
MIEISQYLFYKIMLLLNMNHRNNNIYVKKIQLMEEGLLPRNTSIFIKEEH